MTSHKKMHKLLKDAFKFTEKKLEKSVSSHTLLINRFQGIDFSNSGTCAIAVLIKGKTCYIANLGDSRAVLFRTVQEKKTKKINKLAIELSWDHKPTRPCEKERVKRKGGKIEKLIGENKK